MAKMVQKVEKIAEIGPKLTIFDQKSMDFEVAQNRKKNRRLTWVGAIV